MITQSLSELNSFRINTVIYTYDTVKFLFTLVIKHAFSMVKQYAWVINMICHIKVLIYLPYMRWYFMQFKAYHK